MLLSLTGPRRVLLWTSKFARKLVRSSLGGEVTALSEMVGHTSVLRYFYAPLEVSDPGMAGLGDCGSLFAHLMTRKMITEGFLARHGRGESG